MPDRPQHRHLLARIAVGVTLVEGGLLEEVLAQQPTGPEREALRRRQRVGSEQLDDLEQLRLALEQLAGPGALLLPVGGHLAREPGRKS